MPRRDSRWDDEFDTDDFDPDEDWTDDRDDESATLPCPRCGAEVYEDASYCPRCDADLTEAPSRTPKPWWIILGTLACLWIFWRWILMR